VSTVFELREQIKTLTDKIIEIQNECSHPKGALTKKGGSNTGNWCSGDDRYWYDFHCGLCDKRWTEDQ